MSNQDNTCTVNGRALVGIVEERDLGAGFPKCGKSGGQGGEEGLWHAYLRLDGY